MCFDPALAPGRRRRPVIAASRHRSGTAGGSVGQAARTTDSKSRQERITAKTVRLRLRTTAAGNFEVILAGLAFLLQPSAYENGAFTPLAPGGAKINFGG